MVSYKAITEIGFELRGEFSNDSFVVYQFTVNLYFTETEQLYDPTTPTTDYLVTDYSSLEIPPMDFYDIFVDNSTESSYSLGRCPPDYCPITLTLDE